WRGRAGSGRRGGGPAPRSSGARQHGDRELRLLGFHIPTPRWGRHAWWRRTVTILGLLALCLAVWFGGPMTGWTPLAGLWLRLAIIGVILGVSLAVVLLRWRRRVRAARRIEDALIPA